MSGPHFLQNRAHRRKSMNAFWLVFRAIILSSPMLALRRLISESRQFRIESTFPEPENFSKFPRSKPHTTFEIEAWLNVLRFVPGVNGNMGRQIFRKCLFPDFLGRYFRFCRKLHQCRTYSPLCSFQYLLQQFDGVRWSSALVAQFQIFNFVIANFMVECFETDANISIVLKSERCC